MAPSSDLVLIIIPPKIYNKPLKAFSWALYV